MRFSCSLNFAISAAKAVHASSSDKGKDVLDDVDSALTFGSIGET
jgi:hypothetical protein